MSSCQHPRTLLLAGVLPAALLFLLAACSGESNPAGGSPSVAGTGPEAAVEESAAPAATSDAPEAEPEAEPGRREPAAEKPTRAAVADEQKKPGLPPGHSADDGHDHDASPVANAVRPASAGSSSLLGNLKGPRLTSKVGADKHVFGSLIAGVIVEHTFELESAGTESLIIKQVKPTCGCAVTQVLVEGDFGELEQYTFGDPIPVGRRISFLAKLDTKKKSGHQNTRINIFSNDPRGTVQLGMEADIKPFFTVTPRLLSFGRASKGDVLTRKAVIQSAQGIPVKLELFEQTLPAGGSYELKPSGPDADGRAARWELSMTIGPDLAEGNLARSLMINSDEPIAGSDPSAGGTPETYKVTVPMNAQVVGPFSHAPAYLSMGLVRPGQAQTRTLTVECHDEAFSFAETPPRVRVVGAVSPGTDEFLEWEYAELFTATVRPVDGKNAVDIELRLEGLPDGTKGSFRGTLIIELDHPEKPQIAIVITGLCRG